MSRFGQELVESAKEALAIASGATPAPRVIDFDDVDVAGIRKRLQLSQLEFASRYRLSVATVRDWEQKRRRPDRIAANLLRVIDHSPIVVAEALAGTTQ